MGTCVVDSTIMQEDIGGTLGCRISNKSETGALQHWILVGGIRLT